MPRGVLRIAVVVLGRRSQCHTVSCFIQEKALWHWYALTLRFVVSQAPSGLTRESYVRELHERELYEVNIPKSTGLLHRESLYTSSEK